MEWPVAEVKVKIKVKAKPAAASPCAGPCVQQRSYFSDRMIAWLVSDGGNNNNQ